MKTFLTAAADTWGLWAVIVAFLLIALALLCACRDLPQEHDFMSPWAGREPGDLGGKGARR